MRVGFAVDLPPFAFRAAAADGELDGQNQHGSDQDADDIQDRPLRPEFVPQPGQQSQHDQPEPGISRVRQQDRQPCAATPGFSATRSFWVRRSSCSRRLCSMDQQRSGDWLGGLASEVGSHQLQLVWFVHVHPDLCVRAEQSPAGQVDPAGHPLDAALQGNLAQQQQ